MRLHVPSPEALLPQLPKPQDLQPFPTTLMLKFLGHTGKVSSRQALMTSDVCDLWEATLFQAKRDWYCLQMQASLAAPCCRPSSIHVLHVNLHMPQASMVQETKGSGVCAEHSESTA